MSRTRLIPRLAAVAACVVALAASTGCSNSPTNPTPVTFSQSDLRPGTGAEATAGKTLTVNYTGWLYDVNASAADNKGILFETSLGATPFSFTLGAGQVIAGWDQGLVGLRVGGLRRLVIPPSLAYGATRRSMIPPYATLIFEVELIAVE